MASFLDRAVSSNQVVMFTADWCPYCSVAKGILSKVSNDLAVYNIDNLPQGNDICDVVSQRYGHETVPIIFINGQFVGGCSDVEGLQRSGGLQKLLDQVFVPTQ